MEHLNEFSKKVELLLNTKNDIFVETKPGQGTQYTIEKLLKEKNLSYHVYDFDRIEPDFFYILVKDNDGEIKRHENVEFNKSLKEKDIIIIYSSGRLLYDKNMIINSLKAFMDSDKKAKFIFMITEDICDSGLKARCNILQHEIEA